KVPTHWKTSKVVQLLSKDDFHYIGNYHPICVAFVVYKFLIRIALNRIDRTLDEGQPCEQAEFRKGFSTMDYIHTIRKPLEVSREYKRPLCLCFIYLKNAFDSTKMEAVMQALHSHGELIQCIKFFRELYKDFTTKVSAFYSSINLDVTRDIRQGDTIPPKLFTAALENAMRTLE
ncbi:hypothetical protein Angca_007545, partial [Angiostrongylus cantonensis]